MFAIGSSHWIQAPAGGRQGRAYDRLGPFSRLLSALAKLTPAWRSMSGMLANGLALVLWGVHPIYGEGLLRDAVAGWAACC